MTDDSQVLVDLPTSSVGLSRLRYDLRLLRSYWVPGVLAFGLASVRLLLAEWRPFDFAALMSLAIGFAAAVVLTERRSARKLAASKVRSPAIEAVVMVPATFRVAGKQGRPRLFGGAQEWVLIATSADGFLVRRGVAVPVLVRSTDVGSDWVTIQRNRRSVRVVGRWL